MASCIWIEKQSFGWRSLMCQLILLTILSALPLSVLSQELVPANSTTSSTAPSITSLSVFESSTSTEDTASSISLSTTSIASVSFTSFPQSSLPLSVSSTFSSAFSSSSYSDLKRTITSIIEGKTILSNYYTTITYSPTASASSNKSPHHSGLSKKNRNIIIGCVVGIGAPLILILLILIYMFCVQPKKTDFIDSDGKIVTAYRSNIFTKIWYFLLGKKIGETERFSSDSPIGNSNIQTFEDINPEDIMLNNDNPYTPKHSNIEGYEGDGSDDENLPSNLHDRGINGQYSPTKSTSYSMSNSNSQDYADHVEVNGIMPDEGIHRVYDDSESSIDENYYARPNGLSVTNY
ncbi:AIS_HP2_G0019180.mRNA.1.CDS.1 [Saccharomyces cerevisiae]|nr:AIS_HP2_G0019180.mRNA.1.CDS.1 [Saccharomyces cerevisiae]CAI6515758.1 AIS_HP2_G0019180.mRNA.1.CDS.1 [Saccharomyces cerevisiae]